jgi:trans-aconitate 2-methyltransferase
VSDRASSPRDWDAASYDRVSTPQVEWAAAVLDRLPLAGDETVLDAGCGSGRVTRLLVDRLPRGRVVATDAAPSMVALTREAFAGDPSVEVLDAVDLAELELADPVDAVFSNAVFHWIPDHPRLFARLHALLRHGGRLAAQCGGEGNIDRFHVVAAEVGRREPYAQHLAGWRGPWNFRGAGETERTLRDAGFEGVRCDLERRAVTPEAPLEFATTVCLGHHIETLPEDLREPFARDVVAACGEPLTLDYVRLNITAERPAGA